MYLIAVEANLLLSQLRIMHGMYFDIIKMENVMKVPEKIDLGS
jgi:hypothetical protein